MTDEVEQFQGLTERRMKILGMLDEGYSQREIAKELGTTPPTINSAVQWLKENGFVVNLGWRATNKLRRFIETSNDVRELLDADRKEVDG